MSNHEPHLVFSVDYHDGRDGHPGEVRPRVVWMWVAPRVGDVVDVGVVKKTESGALRIARRCKVVAVTLYTYGSEGVREYAGEMMLAML